MFSADAVGQIEINVGEEGKGENQGRPEGRVKGSKREVRRQRKEWSPALEFIYPCQREKGSAPTQRCPAPQLLGRKQLPSPQGSESCTSQKLHLKN